MVLSEVKVESVGPGTQGGSVTAEEPKLSGEHSLILRDGGNIEGDVLPLTILCCGTVSKRL